MSPETDPNDPKGLIREAYRIEGITEPECRSIFMDWALSRGTDDARPVIADLLARYGADMHAHPMSKVLREGLAPPETARRRGGRGGRMASQKKN